jgi:hypothetical protein
MKLPLAALAALVTLLPAAARDNGDWAQSGDAIRRWFRNVYCDVAPGGV